MFLEMGLYRSRIEFLVMFEVVQHCLQGRIQDFKLGGGNALKKLRRAKGGAKIFGVFRVKNHDFTPKNHIFPILGGAREIFGVFHVKNHDFTPKKSYPPLVYNENVPQK